MTISKGDRLPDVTLVKATENGPEKIQTGDYFAGKKVALFSVPGAFTPTCSARHLPSYVEKAGELKAKGVDEIVGTAVNDAFVMSAWNKTSGSPDITMLADGNGEFAEALGLTMDGSGFGMGKRGQRYSNKQVRAPPGAPSLVGGEPLSSAFRLVLDRAAARGSAREALAGCAVPRPTRAPSAGQPGISP